MYMKKIVFCATDAGGARNIAPLAAYSKHKGNKIKVFAGKDTETLFQEYNIEPAVSPWTDINQSPRNYLISNSIDAIFLGTTRYPNLEAQLTTLARSQQIKCFSIVDEWYGFRQRYQDEYGELSYIPDIICLPDEIALSGAIDEGLPPDRLLSTGSPALESLNELINSFQEQPPERPSFYDDLSRPIILFISESHELDYGASKDSPGPLGAFIGYTENSVRLDIKSCLDKLDLSCSVIEKLHPSADGCSHLYMDNPESKWLTLQGKTPLWPHIWHCDIVIGMRSMALLESAMMAKPVVAYQPNLIGKNICTASKLGLAKDLKSKDELEVWLKKKFALSSDGVNSKNQIFKEKHKGASKRIIELVI